MGELSERDLEQVSSGKAGGRRARAGQPPRGQTFPSWHPSGELDDRALDQVRGGGCCRLSVCEGGRRRDLDVAIDGRQCRFVGGSVVADGNCCAGLGGARKGR